MPLSAVLPSDVVDGVFELATDPMVILSADASVILAMNGAARMLLGQHTRVTELMASSGSGGFSFGSERGQQDVSVRTRAGMETYCAHYVSLRNPKSRFWMVTFRQPVAAVVDAEAQAERLEMIGELAGGLARNFKNVLQAISLSGDTDEGSDGGIVARGVNEALSVGAELLTTWNALAATELFGGRRRRVDYSEAVQRCERLLRQLTRAIEEVIFEYPIEPVEVDADEGQLLQLILTLCFRARDAVARGAGSSMQVRLTAEASQTRLAVTDDGDPLSAAELQVLRGIAEPRGIPAGTLRSLTTLAGLVDAHAGRLRVTSPVNEGKGTEFIVELPRASEAYPRDFGRVPTTTTARRRDSIWTHVHERT